MEGKKNAILENKLHYAIIFFCILKHVKLTFILPHALYSHTYFYDHMPIIYLLVKITGQDLDLLIK